MARVGGCPAVAEGVVAVGSRVTVEQVTKRQFFDAGFGVAHSFPSSFRKIGFRVVVEYCLVDLEGVVGSGFQQLVAAVDEDRRRDCSYLLGDTVDVSFRVTQSIWSLASHGPMPGSRLT